MYMSTKEAAKELGMDRTFILAEIKRGNLRALRVTSRKYRISAEDWKFYLESKMTNAKEGE